MCWLGETWFTRDAVYFGLTSKTLVWMLLTEIGFLNFKNVVAFVSLTWSYPILTSSAPFCLLGWGRGSLWAVSGYKSSGSCGALSEASESANKFTAHRWDKRSKDWILIEPSAHPPDYPWVHSALSVYLLRTYPRAIARFHPSRAVVPLPFQT